MTEVVPSLQCDSPESGGMCWTYGSCDSHVELFGFVFKIQLSSDLYIRVPLQTFMTNIDMQFHTSQCFFDVQRFNTSSDNVGTQQVVLGGLFFREFYGLF